MRRYSFHLFLSLLLALTFTACDSDENGDGNGNGGGGDVGNVSVTLSGGVDGSFSGNAFFVIDEDDEVDFAIGLFSGAITNPNAGEIVVLGRDGDRPGPGTYTIDAEASEANFFGAYVENLGNFASATLVSAQSGTLEITSSSSDEVSGTFSFTGQAFTGSGTQLGETTVSGQFTAEFIDQGNVPTIP